MAEPPRGLWDGALRRLEGRMPEHALEAWIRPLVTVWREGTLVLRAPGELCRERIHKHYLTSISTAVTEELGREVPLAVEAAPRDDAGSPRAGGAKPAPDRRGEVEPVSDRGAQPATHGDGRGERRAAGVRRPPQNANRPSRASASRSAPVQQELDYRFSSFLVGSSNALAREASVALAEGRQRGLSPLCLIGGTGVGKTHLARAVVAEARSQGASRALYTSAERFTTEFTAALKSKQTERFKRRFREECQLLVLEDVQFLSGKEWTQLELFHTLEHLRGIGTPIVLTADRMPRDIDRLDDRLCSQIASGLVAEIEAPEEDLRRRILRTRASAGGVRVPEACIDRLVHAVRGSVRDLEAVLVQIVASASLLKRPIDLELTEQALRKMGVRGDRRPRLEISDVLEVVTGFFGVDEALLRTPSRKREVLLPRQLGMYLCRRFTDATVADIGRAFGRKHPAVTNAIRSVEQRMLSRAPLRYQIEELARRLEEKR